MGKDPAGSLRTAVSPQSSRTSATRSRRCRSRERRVGSWTKSASRPPPPPCHSVAARTLSSTESHPKVCTRWKVLRRPRRARVTADQCVASLPSSHTRPSFGFRTPEMTSKSVVLPAPFGPMSPQTTPRGTVRLTPSRARDAAEPHADAFEREHRVRRYGGVRRVGSRRLSLQRARHQRAVGHPNH